MPGDKLGEKLLDGPYLKAKLEKLYAPHLHTEALMDRWNKEAQAKQKSKKKPKEKPLSRRALRGKKERLLVITDVKEIKEETHGKTKRRTRDRKGRTGSNRKKDKPLAARGSPAEASSGGSLRDGESGQADTGGGIHPIIEKEEIGPTAAKTNEKGKP